MELCPGSEEFVYRNPAWRPDRPVGYKGPHYSTLASPAGLTGLDLPQHLFLSGPDGTPFAQTHQTYQDHPPRVTGGTDMVGRELVRLPSVWNATSESLRLTRRSLFWVITQRRSSSRFCGSLVPGPITRAVVQRQGLDQECRSPALIVLHLRFRGKDSCSDEKVKGLG